MNIISKELYSIVLLMDKGCVLANKKLYFSNKF